MLSFSKPVEGATIRILSLGAGVQSSVLALMAARGDIGPMPDCAIFSDTGWEPKAIYDWLDWLEAQLPFPVYRVEKGNIRDDTLAGFNTTGQRFASIPFFTENGGMARRQCTSEYKISPVYNKIRELLGLESGERAASKGYKVEQWIGISTDEIQRMKDAPQKWITNRWPLIEERMSRSDCLRWMEDRQYPAPEKSACIGCPYRDNASWREMKINDPESFADAVSFDDQLRLDGYKGKLDYSSFIHSSLKPLKDVDFDNAEDRGQISFLDECEGMCGL